MPTQFNTKSPTIKRILREAAELSTSPTTDYHASPLESNLFEWHFTLRGPPSSPYEDGLYHGRIILPATYPLRPPSFRFLTPSGRFETNREICLSISGHHEETWQPAWGIRTALVALRSFMAQEAKGQVGGLECEEGARRRFAADSALWKCLGCGGRSNRDIMDEVDRELEKVGATTAESSSSAAESRRAKKEADDVVIPAELRLAYRDELSSTSSADKTEQPTNSSSQAHASSSSPSPPPPPSLSSFTAPQQPPSTRQHPAPPAPAPVPPPRHPIHNPPNADVPAWIDKAIGALVVSLVIMILKKILKL